MCDHLRPLCHHIGSSINTVTLVTLACSRAIGTYGGTVMSPEEALRSAWVILGGAADDLVATMVLARHAEPHRRYHTATHVMWVLRHVEAILGSESSGEVDDAAIAAAALFHDVVYDPRSTTNERESADLAVRALRDLGWTERRLDVVHRLIAATADHEADDFAAAVLFDADLAILGADAVAYAEYVAGIRFEYCFVDDSAWRVGRSAVLRSFLDRDRIFLTGTMSAARESQARRNLTAELESLGENE
jgi:predicted metal-dependent HD superfamily phosphohydrolase